MHCELLPWASGIIHGLDFQFRIGRFGVPAEWTKGLIQHLNLNCLNEDDPPASIGLPPKIAEPLKRYVHQAVSVVPCCQSNESVCHLPVVKISQAVGYTAN